MKKTVLFITVIIILFTGCSEQKEESQKSTQKKQIPLLPVNSYSVKFEKVDFFKKYSAILKPYNEVDIVARVSGVLVKENFKEGSFVKKGDLLYEIQKSEYKALLNEAEASLQKASANLDRASGDWSRAEYLFKNSAISEEQKDKYLYTYNDAKAELSRAKAVLQNAHLEYGYTTIKAPVSGIIGLSSSDEGAYIDAKNTTSKLSTITSITPIYAQFSIPASDVVKYKNSIKKGSLVMLRNGDREYNGKIDFISPKLDLQTDTLLVRAIFENMDESLIAGAYTEIILKGLSYENIVKLPHNAVVKTPQAAMVYVIKDDNSITMKAVDIASVKDGFAFVSKGLNENDKVVVSNIAKIRPNTKVKIIGGK